MKTIYIVILIVLVGASVFAYIYNQKNENVSTTPATSVPTQQGIQATGATTTTTANGLNPEHGLPGHRCDLPVGAPLTVTKEEKKAAPAKPKTNPQHGMPGHRCDLAVGAPL